MHPLSTWFPNKFSRLSSAFPWLNGLALPNDPFFQPRPPEFLPDDMVVPPQLPPPIPNANTSATRFPTTCYALLINPFYPKSPHGSFGKHVLTPSLALTSIAAATPRHWHVRYWDENLLQGPPPTNPFPALVAITVHLTFARRACELADWYRRQGAKVVLGGPHALSCPEELAPHADALAIGDGVQLWPRILADAENGTLQPRYAAGYENAFEEDPPPNRTILDKESFLTITSLIATRGCHNRCGFCYLATDGLRQPYRTRRPEDIARQFVQTNQPYGVFLDNNLGSRPEYLRALCRELRPLNKIWSSAVTLDVTDDPTLVRDMALAGCTGVFIGFESLSDDALAHARKRTPRTSDYARRIRLFHDHGIQVNGSFVVGFDEDHKDVFERLAHWIEEQRMECATFHILTPYPGTPLFRQMEAEGRLIHRNWDLYDTAHAVFRPKHMSPGELELGYDWLYRRVFSHASIWKRRPSAFTSLPTYLASAYLYKKSNRLWHFLIKHRLVRKAWQPLVAASRLRNLIARRRLAGRTSRTGEQRQSGASNTPFPASV